MLCDDDRLSKYISLNHLGVEKNKNLISFKKRLINNANKMIKHSTTQKGKHLKEAGKLKGALAETNDRILANKNSLRDVSTTCAKKAKEYPLRKSLRKEEIGVMTQAMEIISGGGRVGFPSSEFVMWSCFSCRFRRSRGKRLLFSIFVSGKEVAGEAGRLNRGSSLMQLRTQKDVVSDRRRVANIFRRFKELCWKNKKHSTISIRINQHCNKNSSGTKFLWVCRSGIKSLMAVASRVESGSTVFDEVQRKFNF